MFCDRSDVLPKITGRLQVDPAACTVLQSQKGVAFELCQSPVQCGQYRRTVRWNDSQHLVQGAGISKPLNMGKAQQQDDHEDELAYFSLAATVRHRLLVRLAAFAGERRLEAD